MDLIRTRVYVGTELVSDSPREKDVALHSDRIPVIEIHDLEFHSVEEGREVPESGEVKQRHCCVENREMIEEDGEQIVEIHGNWC